MIRELTESLLKACEEALEYEIYGTSQDHFESVERLPDEESGAFRFRITTWNNISDESRKVREMSLIETMDKLASYIAERATRIAAERIRK
jgi:hypothetical protein